MAVLNFGDRPEIFSQASQQSEFQLACNDISFSS